MDIASLYQLYLKSGLVTTDSRHCPPGSLFIALRGESFDGNGFAPQALANGAAYAVVDRWSEAFEGDSRYIQVADGLATLQALANYHRQQLGTPIIGITGTNGKTTTKELIATVLSQAYTTLYTEGNLNNHIGVPLTLLRLRPHHQVAVVEMGANHPHEIKQLCEIAKPDYGLITNVGKAHLEGFGSFENIVKTKSELYDYLRTKPSAVVFVSATDSVLRPLTHGLTTCLYGEADGLFVSGHLVGNAPFLSVAWKDAKATDYLVTETRLIGAYNLSNVLAAISIGCHWGIEPAFIDRALRAYSPNNSRSQWKQGQHNALIVDAYNANPTSMAAALQNFASMEVARKMIILGEMRELGADSETEHQSLLDSLARYHFEQIWLVGPSFRPSSPQFRHFDHTDAVIQALEQTPLQGYTILLKGSNGVKLERLVSYL